MKPLLENKKVLVVDDDSNFACDLKAWLSREGFGVHVAQVGRAAIQYYNLYRPYSAVILDLHMPKIDGFQVLEAIRKTDSNAKVAVLTADASARDGVVDMGADAFFVKPVRRKIICELINKLTSSKKVISKGGVL